MWLLIAGVACAIAVNAQEGQLQEVRVSAKAYAPVSPNLRVESDLVEVAVVVRGHDGRTIAGLTKEDFQVLDQGKAQEITHFVVETAAGSTGAAGPASRAARTGNPSGAARRPRFIALYFDNFATNSGHLKRAQIAARRFVDEGLDAADRVAVFTSSSGRTLDFTAEKAKLIAAIDNLRPHPLFSEGGLTVCPRITPYQAYQIAVMFDPLALNAAIDEAKACSDAPDDGTAAYARRPPGLDPVTQMVKGQAEATWNQVRAASQATLDAIGGAASSLSNMRGRCLLLLVSSGFLAGTLEREQERLINQALHAGIVINALDAKGLYVEAPGRPIDETLDELEIPPSTYLFEAISQVSRLDAATDLMADFAQSTGGLFFHNNNDLAFGFRELGALPKVTYILAFRPSDIGTFGSYHKLKVRLTSSKSYAIEARPGYFAAAKEMAGPQEDRRLRLDREVMAGSTSQELSIAVTHQSSKLASGAVAVRVQIHIDISQLQFPRRDNRRFQQLKLVAALLDSNGNLVAAKEGTMDFALSDSTYSRLFESGVNAVLNLEAPPGKYRLRGVVQETVEGKIASSLQAVEAQ